MSRSAVGVEVRLTSALSVAPLALSTFGVSAVFCPDALWDGIPHGATQVDWDQLVARVDQLKHQEINASRQGLPAQVI
jgi:hypothetical protein